MSREASAQIRRLQAGDVDELVALIVESFAAEMALAHAGPEGIRGQVRTAVVAAQSPLSLALRMLGQVAELWVATDGGRLVGCYALHGRSELTVSTVAVSPGSRRAGVGTRLMAHAFERARQLGRKRVVLEVLADNTPAVELYRSVGMREYDRRRSYTMKLAGYGVSVLLPEDLVLDSVRRSHLGAWPAVFRASVPSEAHALEESYRAEYIATTASRWLDSHLPMSRTLRRVALVEGRPVAFTCARVGENPMQRMAEILTPLYLPEAGPYLPYILSALTAHAAQSRMSTCRLYLSDLRPESWQVALTLGYAYERTWLYMYKRI